MSDEQPTSWRERFFGSAPADPASREASGPESDEQSAGDHEGAHSAEVAPDEAEVAAQSVDEHDDHQPLVEHASEADTAVLDTRGAADDQTEHARGSHDDAAATHAGDDDARAADGDGGDDRGDSPIEPTVIAPSTLRGPSHSAAHPDDTARSSAHERHDEAAQSSLEQHPEADASDGADAPPALVEPRRPSFGLRRRSEDGSADADAHGTDSGAGAGAAAGIAAGGLAAAAAGGAASRGSDREFVEPEPTQAMDAHRGDDDATRAMDAQRRDDDATQAMDAQRADDGADTRVLDAHDASEQRTQRFGIIRDEVPASSIPVDDETARAAAGGTPIVLVEEPMPPRRKGARAVGFAVALLATLIFAILLAAAFFAVGYLFDRDFDATAVLQGLWLSPSYLLPVIVFFLAYWIVTLVVNRAGWWAHVLGAFLVALLVYAAHIAGAFMEREGGWAAFMELLSIDLPTLGQLLLAPMSVLAFVIAREVPVWVGGIVARRGRRARDWNRQAMEDFNAENDERLAAYERARG